MNQLKTILICLGVMATLAPQASAGSSELVVVVNSANPVASLNKSQLAALYKAKTTEFPNGAAAVALNLPPDNEVRQDFDKAVLNMSADDAKRFWIDMKIRSGGAAPQKLASPAAVARQVAKTPNALGYVPVSDAKGLKIVARIVGGSVKGP